MHKFICIFLLFISPGSTTYAQDTTYTIPFELTPYNNISIKALLNSKDTLHLMFHTAASDLMLTEDATARLHSLKFSGTDIVKSWGGNDNTSRHSEENTLQINDLHWEHLTIWEDKNSGQGTDGKCGPDLFKDKVMVIDFDRKAIEVRTSLPPDIDAYNKLPLTRQSDMLFIQAFCVINTDTISNQLLIHSGYGGELLLDDVFAEKYQLGKKLHVNSEQQLKDSYGNVVKVKKAILPSLVVGDNVLNNISAGFFEGAIGRQKMSIMGGGLLKRFNIVMDAKREFIYIKPSSYYTTG